MTMRKICEIAYDILRDPALKGNSRTYATAYLQPMLNLNTIEDNYFADSGDSIVMYALANLNYYRGENARALKAELKAHLDK